MCSVYEKLHAYGEQPSVSAHEKLHAYQEQLGTVACEKEKLLQRAAESSVYEQLHA